MLRTDAATASILGAVALLGGCNAEDSALEDGGTLTLSLNADVSTLVSATWTSDVTARTRLELTRAGDPVLTTDWSPGGAALDFPILGLVAGTEYTAKLVDEDGETLTTGTVTTGALPHDLSNSTTEGTSSWTGYLATAMYTAGEPYAVILDPRGNIVWYWHRSGEPLSRVRVRRDGLGVWVMGMPATSDVPDPGWIAGVAWDGSLLADIVPVGNDGEGCTHDFYEMEDGSLIFLGNETRELEGADYTGDSVFRWTPGGDEQAVWSFWDSISPLPPADGLDPGDWTHGNALRWSEDSGTLFVGARSISAIFEVDPSNWTTLHMLGGPFPDYQMPTGSPPYHQHQFDLRGNELLVHDNRNSADGTRLVSYTLDREAKTATQNWEYAPGAALFDSVFGDVTYLDDDRFLVTWSTSGYIEERTRDGDAPWTMTLDIGSILGYSQLVPRLPLSTPAGG